MNIVALKRNINEAVQNLEKQDFYQITWNGRTETGRPASWINHLTIRFYIQKNPNKRGVPVDILISEITHFEGVATYEDVAEAEDNASEARRWNP